VLDEFLSFELDDVIAPDEDNAKRPNPGLEKDYQS